MFQIDMRMCDQITRIYERQAEESVRAVNSFYSAVSDIARKTTFEPMVIFSNRIVDFYTGDLKDHLFSEFRKWYESGYSFHALMMRIRAGDSAVSLARSKMDVMHSDLEGMFRTAMEHIKLDTSAPQIDNGDFENFRQALNIAVRSFETATGDAESAVRSLGSGNDVVSLIGDIVKTTGESLQESFLVMVREVTSGEEFTGNMRDIVVDAITGRASTMGTSITIPMVI